MVYQDTAGQELSVLVLCPGDFAAACVAASPWRSMWVAELSTVSVASAGRALQESVGQKGVQRNLVAFV